MQNGPKVKKKGHKSQEIASTVFVLTLEIHQGLSRASYDAKNYTIGKLYESRVHSNKRCTIRSFLRKVMADLRNGNFLQISQFLQIV